MAQNKAKMNKFLTGAVTATMVASAIVPVAAAAETKSYTDVSAADLADVTKAVELGFFKEAAQFNPYNNITRGQVAKTLARYVAQEAGFKTVDEYVEHNKLETTVTPFADVPATHADNELFKASLAVKHAEVFTGSNNVLNGGGNITRAQMASVIVRAFDLKDIEGVDSKVVDADSVDASHKANIHILSKHGLTTETNYRAGEFVKRVQMAKFLNRSYDAVNADVQVVSVTALGANKLEVKFNRAVDTAKAKITVNKGSISTNLEKTSFSEDKTSVLIETTTKLTKGEYTVSVSDLTEKALTKSVSVEDEKISKINVTTTTAPMNSASVSVTENLVTTTFDAGQSALVKYAVVNQYGEKMSNQSITWSQSTGGHVIDDATTGKLTITNTKTKTNFIPGNKIFLTGVHATSGTVVNAEFVIGLESKADQVVFKGVFNTATKKFESLPSGFVNERYVLLFEVNDQYGNQMSLADHNDLVFTANNPLFVGSTFDTTTDVEFEGVSYEAVKLARGTSPEKGGEVTVQAISKVTGKTASYTIQADALAAVKTFTVSAPEKIVAEGEKVEIPFTAVDQYGKAVTKYDALNPHITLSANVGELKFEKQNDGSAKLFFTTANDSGATENNDAPVYLTSLVRDGGSFSSLMVNVKDLAKPAAIIGVDNTVSTSIATGNKVEIKGKDLVVQDQYGRTMTDAKVETWLSTGTNAIIVNSEYAASNDTSAFTVKLENGSLQADAAESIISATTHKFVVEAKTGASIKSNEKLVFALSTDGTNAISSTAKSLTFTNVVQAEYSSYEVADFGTMYHDTTDTTTVNSTHAKTVKVYGLKQDGTKVLLPTADYTVSLNTGKLSYATSKISEVANGFASADFQDASGNSKDVKVQVLVTVNDANGAAAAILEKELLVSNIAPKVETIDTVASKVTNGKATITAGGISSSTFNSYIDEALDQYGVEKTETPTVTITNLKKVAGSSLTVASNGSTSTSITSARMGDTFTATYKYDSGKSVAVEFTVGLDTSAPAISTVTVSGTKVIVSFTEAIDDTTVTSADFTLGGNGLGAATVVSVGTGGTANDNIIEITMDGPLSPTTGQIVTVALSGAGVVSDLNGTVSTSTGVVTFTQP